MSTNEYANTTECHNTRLSHGVMQEEEEEDAGSEPGACCTCEAAAAAAKLFAKPSSASAISPNEDFPTAGDAARTRVASSTIVVPLSSL